MSIREYKKYLDDVARESKRTFLLGIFYSPYFLIIISLIMIAMLSLGYALHDSKSLAGIVTLNILSDAIFAVVLVLTYDGYVKKHEKLKNLEFNDIVLENIRREVGMAMVRIVVAFGEKDGLYSLRHPADFQTNNAVFYDFKDFLHNRGYEHVISGLKEKNQKNIEKMLELKQVIDTAMQKIHNEIKSLRPYPSVNLLRLSSSGWLITDSSDYREYLERQAWSHSTTQTVNDEYYEEVSEEVHFSWPSIFNEFELFVHATCSNILKIKKEIDHYSQ